jgi:hypothetical protein
LVVAKIDIRPDPVLNVEREGHMFDMAALAAAIFAIRLKDEPKTALQIERAGPTFFYEGSYPECGLEIASSI